MRKRITNIQLQTELLEIPKNTCLRQKNTTTEQIEWLVEDQYIKRDEADINRLVYKSQHTAGSYRKPDLVLACSLNGFRNPALLYKK